jgi:hypothetical protein
MKLPPEKLLRYVDWLLAVAANEELFDMAANLFDPSQRGSSAHTEGERRQRKAGKRQRGSSKSE